MRDWLKALVFGATVGMGVHKADQAPKQHPENIPKEMRYASSELNRRRKERIESGKKQSRAVHAEAEARHGDGGELQEHREAARREAQDLAA